MPHVSTLCFLRRYHLYFEHLRRHFQCFWTENYIPDSNKDCLLNLYWCSGWFVQSMYFKLIALQYKYRKSTFIMIYKVEYTSWLYEWYPDNGQSVFRELGPFVLESIFVHYIDSTILRHKCSFISNFTKGVTKCPHSYCKYKNRAKCFSVLLRAFNLSFLY